MDDTGQWWSALYACTTSFGAQNNPRADEMFPDDMDAYAAARRALGLPDEQDTTADYVGPGYVRGGPRMATAEQLAETTHRWIRPERGESPVADLSAGF